MFGFFRWFSSNDVQDIDDLAPPRSPLLTDRVIDPDHPVFAPGTKIAYDAGLRSRLLEDHNKLSRLFTGIVRNMELEDLVRARALMTEFENTFNGFLLLEYTKLYLFLECTMKNDPEKHAVIREFRRKINSVGRLTRAFIQRWQGRLERETLAVFLQHARQVGQLLFARLKAERERLYEIYEMCPAILAGHSTGS